MAYIYIVECNDGTLYTGWTTNIQRRINQHNEGKGAKYTRARRPVVLKYFEEFETKQEAMKREYKIKKMSRKDKIKLFTEKKLSSN
ncbi:GIY-YIG nuclease family protein [Clostridium aestuarii]|uniref:GIY-YIG nuclease family protein n=1 Tax=Clostridium aestuarii TaxID=338193 RepID=A0ABT4CYU6_9CLOT|nr:GIY-YIG nuclease family protein [Clostridium aestuarii]MCY6484140.1 GIY-YIG nuclease family protein [Clostridium aestuarii]